MKMTGLRKGPVNILFISFIYKHEGKIRSNDIV